MGEFSDPGFEAFRAARRAADAESVDWDETLRRFEQSPLNAPVVVHDGVPEWALAYFLAHRQRYRPFPRGPEQEFVVKSAIEGFELVIHYEVGLVPYTMFVRRPWVTAWEGKQG